MESWLRVSNQAQRVESRGDDKGGNEKSVGHPAVRHKLAVTNDPVNSSLFILKFYYHKWCIYLFWEPI